MKLLVTSLALLLAPLAFAQNNWSQWRGPTFNGYSPATNLPSELNKDKPLWVTAMPGHSNGTPIVHGDHVFTTAAGADGKLYAICLSKKDGKILWQREVAQQAAKNNRNDYATPSPVTDGKKTIFLFGQGELVAFDYEGKELWHRSIWKDHGQWNILWLYGSSPLLYNGKLYVQVLHRNIPAVGLQEAKPGDKLTDSYILAVDPETGKDLWKVTRPSEARVESQESYGTPIPWEKPTRNEILITGGDCITGHDPNTGQELWRAGGWNPERITHWRLVPSAVTFDGIAYVCPPKGGQIRAWREGGNGDVTATHLAWQGNALTSDVAVPLIYNNLMYVLDGDKKQLHCVDPMTGNKKWSGTIDSRPVLRTSPTGAEGKIYVMNEAGDVWVLATDEFKILSKVSLGSEMGGARGSVAVVDGMILIRTGDKVWAFGK